MELDLSQLVNAGVPGIILVWFMFRLERILARFDLTVALMARAIIRLLEREDPHLASSLSKDLSRATGDEERG